MYVFDTFRVDVVRGALLRGDEPVSLTAKTFEILLVLIRHSPETVSKDALLKQVWPETFVEESNLTQHISMLRKALGEAPQDRRYIVTVPGRGYRFVAEVREIPDREPPSEETPAEITAAADPLRIEVPPGTKAESSARSTQRPGLSRALFFKAAAIVLALVLALGAAFRYNRDRHQSARALGEKDTILLSEIDNTTGEPVFDGALNEGLAVVLSQSPFLELASRDRVRETLRFMGRSPDERVRPPLAVELCERLGSKALISGSIGRLGNSYVLSIEAIDCSDGSTLAREQAQADKKEQVLAVLGKSGRNLRRKLGESLASIQKFDVPIQQATTQSLEALKAYSLGMDERARGSEKDAIPLFRHATELDPNFAMAYALLGGSYRNLGETEKAAECYKEAFAVGSALSEREKLYLSVRYYETVEGNIEKAIETNEIWRRMYPRDPRPVNSLAAGYQVVGQYEKAVDAAQTAIRLDPKSYVPYANLATSLLALNRFEEAKQASIRADQAARGSIYTHRVLYELAYLQHDAAAMDREANWARGSDRENDMLGTEAAALTASGRVSSAQPLLERSWAKSQSNGLAEDAAYSMANEALSEADMGNYSAAKLRAEAALKIGRGIDAEEVAAEAFAIAGNVNRAQQLVLELQRRFPLHGPLNRASLPSTLAVIELQHNRPSKAIELLTQAAPYDLCEFASLSPLYTRGLAYLRAGLGKEAAEQFQSVVDHPGIDPLSQRHPLAHLYLARAYLLMGDRDRSRKSYQDFLAMWSGADDTIPVLKKARQELAQLK